MLDDDGLSVGSNIAGADHDPIGHRVDAMLEDDRPTGGTLSYAAGAVRPSGKADSLDGPPAVAESEVRAAAEPAAGAAVDGPAHRRLIRATLPRVEGQPQAVQRQAPDFTIRQDRKSTRLNSSH